MEFNWEEFIGNKTLGVLCKTYEEAKAFCDMMHARGLKWAGGQPYNTYRHCTRYPGKLVFLGNGLFWEEDLAKVAGYTILTFSDYF